MTITEPSQQAGMATTQKTLWHGRDRSCHFLSGAAMSQLSRRRAGRAMTRLADFVGFVKDRIRPRRLARNTEI